MRSLLLVVICILALTATVIVLDAFGYPPEDHEPGCQYSPALARYAGDDCPNEEPESSWGP